MLLLICMGKLFDVIDKDRAGHDSYIWTLKNDSDEIRIRGNSFDKDVRIVEDNGADKLAIERAKQTLDLYRHGHSP